MQASTMTLYSSESNRDDTMTRLPSWGDPMLPLVWKMSEGELNRKFPLSVTMISEDSKNCSFECEDRNECALTTIPDPWQTIDNDMVAICNEDKRDNMDDNYTFPNGLMDVMKEGLSQMERLDAWSTHDLEDDEREQCTSMDISDEMETGVLPATEESRDDSCSGDRDDSWTIETLYDNEKTLCFRLKMIGGAYMLLFQEEILDSIKVLLDETFGSLNFFRLQSIDGHTDIVDVHDIVSAVSGIICSEEKKRTIQTIKCNSFHVYGFKPSLSFVFHKTRGRNKE